MQLWCIPIASVLVSPLSHRATISSRDNHSGSRWCCCHDKNATKVNGAHFDDKAGTAKCCFTAFASWMLGGMTKCVQERLTPPLQPLQAIRARAHLLNDSPPTSSSSFTLTSSSTPPPSPWPWRNDRPFNYLPRLIAADCDCCELFRLCWNCSLNGKEAERARYCGSNKLHGTHVKHWPLSENKSCGSLTVPINEAEQGNGIELACTVVTKLPAQRQISTAPLL